jgi:hypothetical protein
MRHLTLATTALLAIGTGAGAADPPRLIDLHVQTVNGTPYFRAAFERPADLWLPGAAVVTDRDRLDLAQTPRLVPQDGQTRDVVYLPETGRDDGPSLKFVGRGGGTGRAKFVLFYARAGGGERYTPVEVPVQVDFDWAGTAPPPDAARRPDRPPVADDLEGRWAAGRAHQFAVLEAQAPEFGFYGLARAATSHRYSVAAPALDDRARPAGRDQYRRLYETTTGAAALTESLQLERALGRRRTEGPREIDVASLPGIDIAEHPWEKMMAGQRPDPEPLAQLVPHDNYYLHFKSFAKFVELGDFLDDWGTAATRAYEVQSRDYRLRERYEKQLCLKTSLLGRTLGPLVIKGLAVTGSDAYLREGSDVAVIFHVVNADLFRAGVEPYLAAARKEFGDRLHEAKQELVNGGPLGAGTIETFVTPQREVSLHRAWCGEYVIYANSRAGLFRILETGAGRRKSLADGLDFQYMRTVFRRTNAAAEDGFLFLSDAFIRQLVGPASKIKEKRRLEGLAGLHLATNAALWHAWEMGRPPADRTALPRAADLKPADLATPDQDAVAWDAERQVAVSDRYNTIHFATPLVELPIDRVSREEQQDYARFRGEYLGLWRRYFDPVGMRVRLAADRVRVETHILPLIQSTEYAELRRTAGGEPVPLDVAPPTGTTVAQLLSHLSPEAQIRGELGQGLGAIGVNKGVQWLGDWFVVRFDDSPAYAKVAAAAERGNASSSDFDELIEAVFQMPATLGVQIRNPLVFAGVLAALRNSLLNALPGAVTWEPMEPEYKGVRIVRIRATEQGAGMARRFGGWGTRRDPFLPAIYYALVDGVWYASLQEQPIKDMIDRAARPAEKPAVEARRVNSALYISPDAAAATKAFARGVLEREARRRALQNAPVWYALAKAGLLDGKADEAARQAVLYRYLGYVPVSPDGVAYLYDPRADEVTNTRHGSPRRPTPRPAVDADSPVGRLLERFRTVTADLRFREDGIQTAVELLKK